MRQPRTADGSTVHPCPAAPQGRRQVAGSRGSVGHPPPAPPWAGEPDPSSSRAGCQPPEHPAAPAAHAELCDAHTIGVSRLSCRGTRCGRGFIVPSTCIIVAADRSGHNCSRHSPSLRRAASRSEGKAATPRPNRLFPVRRTMLSTALCSRITCVSPVSGRLGSGPNTSPSRRRATRRADRVRESKPAATMAVPTT